MLSNKHLSAGRLIGSARRIAPRFLKGRLLSVMLLLSLVAVVVVILSGNASERARYWTKTSAAGAFVKLPFRSVTVKSADPRNPLISLSEDSVSLLETDSSLAIQPRCGPLPPNCAQARALEASGRRVRERGREDVVRTDNCSDYDCTDKWYTYRKIPRQNSHRRSPMRASYFMHSTK